MKKSRSRSRLFLGFLIIVLIFSGSFVLAEETKETELEEFFARTGVLIIRDRYSIGEIDGQYGSSLALEAIVSYEPGREEDRKSGIRIEIEDTRERTGASYLDFDELPDLLSAVEYLNDLSQEWATEDREYTETTYTSEAGFKIGFYQQETSQTAYAESNKITGRLMFFPNTKDLNDVAQYIREGINLLEEK